MKLLAQLLFFMLLLPVGHACTGKVFTLTFLSGYRVMDGTGDLALNKSVIQYEYDKLAKKYGDCLKVNIVYVPEAINPRFQDRLKNKFKVVKDIYQGPLFSKATEAMFDEAGEVKAPMFVDPKSGITHYTAQEYVAKVKSVDLQLMVSDTFVSAGKIADFQISRELLGMGNTVTFLEHNGKTKAQDFVHQVDPAVGESQKNLLVRVNTGAGSSGMFFDEGKDALSKKKVAELLRTGVVDKKYFDARLGGERLATILESGPVIVPSYLNAVDPSAEGAAKKALFFAYADYVSLLEKTGKKQSYVLFSNLFEKYDQAYVRELFEKEFYKDVYDPKKKQVLLQELDKFLKEDLVILNKGKNPLPPSEFKSLFSQKNGAKFQIASGFSSYQDIVSQGGLPIFLPRKYHEQQAMGLSQAVVDAAKKLKAEGKMTQEMFHIFGTYTQNLNHFYPRGSQDYRNFVEQYNKHYQDFPKISAELKKSSNAYEMLEQAVDAFYSAKQVGAREDLGARVLEKAMFEPSSENRFLTHLGLFSEEVPEKAGKFKPKFSEFCIKRGMAQLFD